MAAVEAADLKSLELLFDYTKFHIGVYLTMASAFITVASVKKGDSLLFDIRPALFWIAVICFFSAGISAGVIASSITQCFGHLGSDIAERCTSSASLLAQRLGPWEIELFTGRTWTQIEHTTFWIGLMVVLFAFKRRL